MDANWRDQVLSYIRAEAMPADKFGHQPRLYNLAKQIAEDRDLILESNRACDDDVLYASAWMHDLGVFLGHRPSDPAELQRGLGDRAGRRFFPGERRGS